MITMRDSVLSDIPDIYQDLRELDRLEALRLGVNTLDSLRKAYSHSLYCKTFRIDNEIAAMSGVAGNLFGDIGIPFLLTTNKVYEISPFTFSRIYIDQVRAMLELYPRLENYVDASYKGAVKLLKIAGFKLEGPLELGPKKHSFYKFSMDRNQWA